jgi:YYY domain-containing protein
MGIDEQAASTTHSSPQSSRRIPWRYALSMGIILLAAGWLRLTGVDWDHGAHLHPDERFLTMVAADIHRPDSIGEYFDTARSPLNPANVGRPFFVYGTLPLFLVRAVAEATGLVGYDRIYLVGRVLSALFDLGTIALTFWLGLRVAGPRVAVGASALLAFSVISIQQAHFFTVDSAATCLTTLALVMLVRIIIRGDRASHVFFGIAFGLVLSSRINLVLLGFLYTMALLYLWRAGRMRVTAIATSGITAAVSTMVVFRLFQPYAFVGPGFFDVAFANDFLQSTATIRGLVTGAVDYPPSVQWIGRVPILSAGANLFLWGIGPAWALTAVAGIAWCLTRRRAGDGENLAAGKILMVWAPTLFLFHAVQFAATLRYFLPIIPVLAVAAGWMLGRRGATRAQTWLLGSVIVLTACWGVAFSAIYQRPHTRVAASEWIYDNVPPSSAIAVEHWDDGLPLGLATRSPASYRLMELKLYDDENDNKRRQLIDTLDAASVIAISSNRLYASIPRAPWKYPLARRYYELLFSGQLGFELEQVFTSYPRIGSIEVVDDDAEEAFTVYDHPKVLVFRKTGTYSRARVATLLNAVPLDHIIRVPPREASALYRRMQPTAIQINAEANRRNAVPSSAIVSLDALARWLAGLEVLSLAFFALLFRASSAARDRGYGLSKLVAWAGCGTIMWLLASTGVAIHTRGTLRTIAVLIVIAGAAAAWRSRFEMAQFWRDNRRLLVTVEAIFLLVFAIFLAVRMLNPAIFWGEKPMDFAILNATARATVMPPADPWFAGEALNYFYFGHALTAFFAEITGVPTAFAFNLAIATVGGLLATAAFLFGYQLTVRLSAGFLAVTAVVLLGNLAGARLWFAKMPGAFNFDYFWATSRVVPNTINEYPFWSLVFADLHAHVLAMPFEAALLYLGSLWIAPGASANRTGSLFLAAMTAWFGGIVAVTSSWSTPTVVALQLGLLATAWLQRGPTLGSLAYYSAIAIAMLGLARALFSPFWAHYAAPVGQWGWVRQEFAPIADVLTIFGVFLVATLPLLIRTIRDWTGGRAGRIAAAVIGLAVAVAIGSLRSPSCGLFVGWSIAGAIAWASAPNATIRTGALLIAAAGAIGAGTETLFVWDRMNTVFKFYLQMWILLGCGSALLAWSAIDGARHRWKIAVPIALVAAAAAFTSVTAMIGFVSSPHAATRSPTLDGLAYLETANPSERAAYEWANREIVGIPVVLEAHGASYQAFSRVSMNTGLPTLLGWEYHLFQQGRSRDEIDARARDVREIYQGTDTARLDALLRNYRVDYIFVGPLERQTYGSGVAERFANSGLVEAVFKSGDVTIFALPGRVATAKTWIEKTPPPPAVLDPLSPLREPRGIAVANDGTILVADFGHRRIQRLGKDLQAIGAFGVEGDGPAQFRDPSGIAVGADGRIWVADTWNHRIQAFTPDGRQVAEWQAGLYGPRGIALGPGGVVYLTDTGNKRVLKFASDGTFEVIADRGVLDNPIGIATDRLGEIYVADVGHRRVVVLSPGGQLLREWPIEGWQPGARVEPFLAVGPDDAVWVTDPPNHRVLIFTREGQPLGTAVAASPLTLPLGIVIQDRATALVTDAATNAVISVRRTDVSGTASRQSNRAAGPKK